MTFVVVGGGPTGVEMAGQLRELSRRALHRNYRRIDTHKTRVVLVEGGDGLVASMGPADSPERTARDLERMGVEIHLGAMVTDMDDQCVVITKTRRLDRAHRHRDQGVGGRHPTPSAWARCWPTAPGPRWTRPGRSRSNPTARWPPTPRCSSSGDLMALDDLPALAEVAMQSGAHAAHTIERRLEGKEPKPFHYRGPGHAWPSSRASRPWPRSDRCAGRLPRLVDLAGRPHHLPDRVQEPLRRPGPLDHQLHRARALRAGPGRALGGRARGRGGTNLRKVPGAPANDPRGDPCPSPSRPLPG